MVPVTTNQYMLSKCDKTTINQWYHSFPLINRHETNGKTYGPTVDQHVGSRVFSTDQAGTVKHTILNTHDGSMMLLYMVQFIWIPSIYPIKMLALIYQHHGSVMGYR